ncbi:macro domain-containing protein [Pseudooceanicola nanhaiensis]|uniref:macro domain-containing protein n=1 Tax=Pseudooceanicola nanhaiensis TaxID=375761 RepID=UPI004059DABD
MLIYKRTSLLDTNTQTLVNTVNCVGVMGKGIAKEFKKRNPNMFDAYKRVCDQKLLEPGKLWLWRGSPNWVLNFPTKKHWRNPSRLEWVEAGLKKFVLTYEAQGITEVSFPMLGCGNGGLDWRDVKPLMERYLSDLSIPVYVHDFAKDMGLPEHLEHLATEVRSTVATSQSFSSFLATLQRIATLSPTISLDDNLVFRVGYQDEMLIIHTNEGSWTFEEDDLRGVWLSLMNGLVTKEKAGWTASGAAMPLLTLMRLMPDVRGVQIQRRDSDEPELAVELRPSATGFFDTLGAEAQSELPWH